MKRILFCLALSAALPVQAQELLCNVSIDAGRIQSDRSVFEDMQRNIANYLNSQRWTPDEFQGYERIRCNLQIIVTQRPQPDFFVCTANLQVYRPAYNSTYETLLLNVQDPAFSFRYVAFQNLVFVDNTYTDNLTALLNFYAYLILGFDYSSFSPEGGMPWFRKAQEILNQAGSSAAESGWRSNEDTRNRYWVIENLMNSSYKGFHTILYKYHRQGLDLMESSPDQGRRAIMECVKELQKLNQQNPLLVVNRMFLNSKDEELVRIFKNAFVNDQKEFVQVMQEIDPANMAKYNSVLEK
ncbi:MAG: DUF4835 family protein [Bacteroidia bacterium]|nr:DUF4835 family protein [Bacteroidia bacterium]